VDEIGRKEISAAVRAVRDIFSHIHIHIGQASRLMAIDGAPSTTRTYTTEFLGSEARRIRTAPVAESDRANALRNSFNFCLASPCADDIANGLAK
jgi:hypothetical protein